MCVDCEKYIKEGKCKADCCGCFPVEKKFVSKNKHKIPKNKIVNFIKIKNTTTLLPVTLDASCPWLDKENYKCLVYNNRPEVCRKFGKTDIVILQCPHYYNRSIEEHNKIIDSWSRVKGYVQ